jgi:hypothetical protein
LAARLIVEIDGETHDHTIAADERRTQWLERQGFRVIRFMNSDVMRNTEGVVQAIQNELRTMGAKEGSFPWRPSRTPPPTPSRNGYGIHTSASQARISFGYFSFGASRFRKESDEVAILSNLNRRQRCVNPVARKGRGRVYF